MCSVAVSLLTYSSGFTSVYDWIKTFVDSQLSIDVYWLLFDCMYDELY